MHFLYYRSFLLKYDYITGQLIRPIIHRNRYTRNNTQSTVYNRDTCIFDIPSLLTAYKGKYKEVYNVK